MSEVKVKRNELESLKWMGKAIDEYFAEVRRAPEEGKKVCWHIAVPGTLMTTSQGILTIMHAHVAAYIGARHLMKEVFEVSEDEGFLSNTCCYMRTFVGLAMAKVNGVKLPPQIDFPLPDLINCMGECQEQFTMAELLSHKTGAPAIIIDPTPSGCVTKEDFDERVKYLEKQLKEVAIPMIEKVSGHRYDYAALSEAMAVMKKCAILRNKCVALQAHRPAPMTLFDLGVGLAPFIVLQGKPGTVEFYERFLAELEDRVAKGIGAVPDEKYRLYWDNYTMWRLLGVVGRELINHHANIVIGRYPLAFYPDVELIDPENPLHSLAECNVSMLKTLYPHWASEMVNDYVEKFDLDGLLMPASPTCRMFDIGQHDIVDACERKHGVPGLIFEGDMVDIAFFNEAQFKTRFEAFLETIDARKKWRRG